MDEITLIHGDCLEKMKKILIVLILAIVLVACSLDEANLSDDVDWKKLNNLSYVGSYIDYDFDVVCWIYHGYQQGGIDCIPLDQISSK